MSFLFLLDVDVTGFSNPLYLVADMYATVPSSPFCLWVPSVPFPSSPHSLLHSLQGGVKRALWDPAVTWFYHHFEAIYFHFLIILDELLSLAFSKSRVPQNIKQR